MDFYNVMSVEATTRSKSDITVTVDFVYGPSKDLVCKGGKFYAFWDVTKSLWNTNVYDLYTYIDDEVYLKKKELEERYPDKEIGARTMKSHSSGLVTAFEKYISQSNSPNVTFNSKILYLSDESKKEDYVTNKLTYDPKEMDTPAFDEMLDILYSKEEQAKILWFMGLVLSGQARKVEKFMYLYGGKGSGKGTVINIFRKLLDGFIEEIDLELLTGGTEFATSQVKETPLLIDPDSDISKIKKDVNLLKLTSHEPITVNKKWSQLYDATFTGLLITASNQRYQVKNVDAGITRRAVVVEPSGNRIPRHKYDKLKGQLKFEIPGIAYKALKHIKEVGLHVYENSMDVAMSEATDLIFSFIREYSTQFGDVITLTQAASLYKDFLEDLGYDTRGYKRRIKIELQRYYDSYYDQKKIDGVPVRNVYVGLKRDIVYPDQYEHLEVKDEQGNALVFKKQESIFDRVASSYQAQLTTSQGTPIVEWDKCQTTLSDIDTSDLHFVRLPLNHIVIDLDLKNAAGEKDLALNRQEAQKYPETYSEISKSGNGIHLHYYYDGDVSKLAPTIKEDVEIKVFTGKQSLRRKLTLCNDKEIVHISTGMPYKEESLTVNSNLKEISWNEKKIRTAIEKNLSKAYHSATKPSIDFIAHILEQANADGVKYDLSDLKNDVLVFATLSSHNADYCMRKVSKMVFKNIEEEEIFEMVSKTSTGIVPDEDLFIFDLEVFPNLLIVGFKQYGKKERTVWYNPEPAKIEWLLQRPLVGFNNRGYDNHIIYRAMQGASCLQLYTQSQAIINGDRGDGKIAGAYEISYADIYEYASKKQSVKKWEIELGITHDELEFPWDQPLAEEDWPRAGEYCLNDVDAHEVIFNATYADYKARKILSELTGLPVNATTQQHAAKWLFGDDPTPQEKFVYTDLATIFPGYKYSFGKSEYMGEDPSEGGLVRHKTGVWENVELDDVVSMHPHAAKALNYFGPYQERFNQLIDARVAVKHHNFELAGTYFNGALTPYLTEDDADDLAYALKIVINIVYGMTSAKFDNKFRHPKNVDNIIAKYGALFMITLKNELEKMNVNWVHIKTDSIKIADCTPEVRQFVFDFGKKYGFDFEHEATYEIMALVNKSVYIAKYGWAEKAKKIGTWEAVGSQYAMPYVFKTLFTKEPVELDDYAITKQATAPIYIDDRFIGKVCQVYASHTGGNMFRVKDEKQDAITGTKGFKWKLFSEMESPEDIDMSYYEQLVIKGLENIDKVGSASDLIPDLPVYYSKNLLPF